MKCERRVMETKGKIKKQADLVWGDGVLRSLPELIEDSWVISEILLTPYEDDGQSGTKVHDLRDPLKSTR